MTGEARPITSLRSQSNIDLRTRAAIDRLFSQQRLVGAGGIQVRLSNQNQVFLNTKLPIRVGVPATLLEEIVPGFEAGVPSVLKVT